MTMELPKVRSSTARGRPRTSLPAPLQRSLNGLPPRLPPPPVARRSTIERLAKPKAQVPYSLPADRPSVYWLDYLIDPRPHQMRDPNELASYYEEFEPRFPRTRSLSTPRTIADNEKKIGTRSKVSQQNIPGSARNRKTSDRSKDLARPRSTVPSPRSKAESINASGNMSASKSRTSMSSVESGNNNAKELSLDDLRHKADFSRGDFSSTTKFNYHPIK